MKYNAIANRIAKKFGVAEHNENVCYNCINECYNCSIDNDTCPIINAFNDMDLKQEELES